MTELAELRAQVAAQAALIRALLYAMAATAGPSEALNALASLGTIARNAIEDCPVAVRRAALEEVAAALTDVAVLFAAVRAQLAPGADTVN